MTFSPFTHVLPYLLCTLSCEPAHLASYISHPVVIEYIQDLLVHLVFADEPSYACHSEESSICQNWWGGGVLVFDSKLPSG